MDRRAELDRFKQINLSLIAAEFGFEIDRKKSTRHSVLMRRGGEKIVISRNKNHYIFFSVHDTAAGTAVDFIQQLVHPGCSLGEVRKTLRPFLGKPALHRLATREFHHSYQHTMQQSEYDQAAVHRRYHQYEEVGVGDIYLVRDRSIPDWVLASPRVAGRVRRCPKPGTILFPHWDQATGMDEMDTPICGYEIKHHGVSMYCKSGKKGLWMTRREPGDDGVVFVESGLDGLSFMALGKTPSAVVCSVGGQIAGGQVEIIETLLRELPPGAQVVAAFDHDEAGARITERLAEIVAGVGRIDLQLRENRPAIDGQDWNDVLRASRAKLSTDFEASIALR